MTVFFVWIITICTLVQASFNSYRHGLDMWGGEEGLGDSDNGREVDRRRLLTKKKKKKLMHDEVGGVNMRTPSDFTLSSSSSSRSGLKSEQPSLNLVTSQ